MPSKSSKSDTSGPTIQSITISKIRMDGGTQPRAQLFEEVVAEYAEDMQQGATFPPVTIYYDGQEYWLADGFHRVRAKEAIKQKEISAEVHFGTQRDAVLYAVGANAAHGLRRTNADKRRSVERLLRDPEWSRWSDREIARRCGVSPTTANTIRKSLFPGDDFQGVNREEGITPHSDNPSSSVRLVQRGGKVQTMDTANIGKSTHKSEKITNRKRAKKQTKSNAKALVIKPKHVQSGDTWKLGKSHYLLCGDPSSKKFLELLPSEIALLLIFPQTLEEWPQLKQLTARSVLSFYTSFGEDLHLETLRGIIEHSLTGTTDANDTVVIINLLDPSLFILIDELECACYCAEPNPQRCTDALAAWSITKQPSKKL